MRNGCISAHKALPAKVLFEYRAGYMRKHHLHKISAVRWHSAGWNLFGC